MLRRGTPATGVSGFKASRPISVLRACWGRKLETGHHYCSPGLQTHVMTYSPDRADIHPLKAIPRGSVGRQPWAAQHGCRDLIHDGQAWFPSTCLRQVVRQGSLGDSEAMKWSMWVTAPVDRYRAKQSADARIWSTRRSVGVRRTGEYYRSPRGPSASHPDHIHRTWELVTSESL